MAKCEKCGKSIPDYSQFCDECWSEATEGDSKQTDNTISKTGLDISDRNSAFGSNLSKSSNESLKYLSGLSIAIGVIDFLIIIGVLIVGLGEFIAIKNCFEKYEVLIYTLIKVTLAFIVGWLLIAFVDMMRDIRAIRKRISGDD